MLFLSLRPRKVEREKEELSQELISAKLQVAQLYMEVDGLKLQHRQATIAAEAAHAVNMGSASGSPAMSKSDPPSPASRNSYRSPRSPRSPISPLHMSPKPTSPSSPTSPHTMEL